LNSMRRSKREEKEFFWARVLSSKIDALVQATERPFIIYGSACTVGRTDVKPSELQIDQSDKVGWHEVLERLDGSDIDILIHSPGGIVEAAETIIEEIRGKFSHLRFFVPSYAKSAATMMVMAGDEIVLDDAAELGPIDPQVHFQNGVSPAKAIQEQFERARDLIKADPSQVSAWYPILQQMGPSLLIQCENAENLSKNLVKEWLTKWMFRGATDEAIRAEKVSNYLADYKHWLSHGRRIKLEHLSNPEFGLKIKSLREDSNIYQKIYDIYLALDIIFVNYGIFKIFYNSLGDCLQRSKQMQGVAIQIPKGKS